MKHILLPTDFSANSWNALEYAVGLFKKIPCNFYVLHIGKLNQSTVKGNSIILSLPRNAAIREKLNLLFERIERLPQNSKHHFIALQEHGNLIDSVRKTVDDKNIDLIVMGTKGASGLKESIIGSNTGDVITRVACNVLVVPEKATIVVPPKNIAFPTDYNIFYSHSILEAISEVLNISKSKLQVLNVSKSKAQPTQEQEKNRVYLEDYLEETFKNAHRFYDIVNKSVKIAIQEHVAIGNADMVIMVAKNLNFLQNLFFDSTVEKLSFHTTVPLLVLHE